MSDEVGKRLATLGALLELEEAVAQGDLKAAQPCRDKRLILAGDLFIRDRKRHGFRIWAGTANVQALVGDYNRDGYADIVITGGLGWFTIPCALSKGDGTFLVHNDNTTSIRSGNDLRRQVRTLPCGRWATFAESIERSGLGLEPGRPRQTYQSGRTHGLPAVSNNREFAVRATGKGRPMEISQGNGALESGEHGHCAS